jgi:hypothetical protein
MYNDLKFGRKSVQFIDLNSVYNFGWKILCIPLRDKGTDGKIILE